MVFALIGLLFNLATFPGLLLGGAIQQVIAGALGAPMAHVAIDEEIEDEQQLFEMTDEEVRRHVVRLDDGESAPEGMREEFVVNYAGVESYAGVVAVVLGPFFVCTTLAFVGFLVAVPLEVFSKIAFFVVGWLSFSTGAHAFPNASATDALWRRSKSGDSLLRVVGYPIVGLAMLVDLLEFLWLDAIYALVLLFAADGLWGLLA